MQTIEEALRRYMDDNKMYCMEGERGVNNLTKIAHEVCGYTNEWGGVLLNFLADNPGAIEAVIDWIGKQKVIEWKDNLESLVGPDEEDEVGDLAPEDEACGSISREGWDG